MAMVYILSDNGKLQKKGATLQLYGADGTITTLFPFKTDQIILLGNVVMTGSALRLLMHHHIDTIFLSKNGRFNGKLAFKEGKNVFLRQKQFKLLENDSFRLEFAKRIVEGKLKNQITFMQRIKRRRENPLDIVTFINKMKMTLKSVSETKNLNKLRGYEGIGARYFFSVFRENIIQDWAIFNGRSMHPPKDNVNSVLSFLYTLIFETFANLLKTRNLTKSAEGRRQEIGKTQFSHRISF